MLGWDEGIVGMQVGGERKLTIPAAMAYGKKGSKEIPGNSTLIFGTKTHLIVDFVTENREQKLSSLKSSKKNIPRYLMRCHLYIKSTQLYVLMNLCSMSCR